jgi:hypothetical protein
MFIKTNHIIDATHKHKATKMSEASLYPSLKSGDFSSKTPSIFADDDVESFDRKASYYYPKQFDDNSLEVNIEDCWGADEEETCTSSAARAARWWKKNMTPSKRNLLCGADMDPHVEQHMFLGKP